MATSQKISIVGTESAGKTVFLAAITHALSAQATFPRISAKNVLTVRYTAGVYDQLELGEWPKSTDVGIRQNLGWLWHARDQSKHELQTFDCAGQDFRTIFESESDNELSAQQLALKKEFYESDLILLLINLQRALDIYKVPGKNSERINIEFAAAAAVRKLRQQGVTIYALFTQYDRCRERVERDWNGDITLALKTLLPDLHVALVETGSAFAAIAAIETEPRNGEILPKVGCQTGDLSAIVTGIDDFLVKNASLAAQREQRRLAEEERKQNLIQEQSERKTNKPPPLPKSTPPPLPVSWTSGNSLSIPALKPNATRAKIALFMIWVLLIADVLFSFRSCLYLLATDSSGTMRHGFVSDIAHGINQLTEPLWFVLWIILVISGISFIRWFWRSYENVKLFSGTTRFTTGWACGVWFTPFINLWRPYQIMKDIFQQTNEFLNKCGQKQELKTGATSGWGFLWIIFFISELIAFIIGWSSFCYPLDAIGISPHKMIFSIYSPLFDYLRKIDIILIISHILGIPLALLTIRLIKRQSEAEKKIASLKTA